MFRTVPLSITSSFSLYTQQWYMSYRFADSLRAGSGPSEVRHHRCVGSITKNFCVLHIQTNTTILHTLDICTQTTNDNSPITALGHGTHY